MGLTESARIPANKDFEERFVPHLRQRLEQALQFTCKEPARIRSVRFNRKGDAVSITIAWPFRIPEPTGDSGDLFGTETDIRALEAEFRKHLLQQKIGRKLSNLLQKEFVDFSIVYLRIAAWRPRLVDLVNTPASRRLAGRPRQVIDKNDKKAALDTVRSIRATLDEVRTQIKIWNKNDPHANQDRILKKVQSKFGEKMRDWFSIFRRQIPNLPLRDWIPGDLSNLQSWSSRELGARIARDLLLQKKGRAPTLAQLKALTRKKVKHVKRK